MWRNDLKIRVPEPTDAFPGRAERIQVPARHFVNGAPMQGPFPAPFRTALFGMGCFWGAERKFWERRVSTRPRWATPPDTHPNPNYREVCSGMTGHDEVVLVVFDPRDGQLRRAAEGVLGEPRSRRRACVRATTSARNIARVSTTTTSQQRAAAEASRDAYQHELTRRRLRPDHHRDPAGAGILLRRGISPAISRQESGRLLWPRRHRRELPVGHRGRRQIVVRLESCGGRGSVRADSCDGGPAYAGTPPMNTQLWIDGRVARCRGRTPLLVSSIRPWKSFSPTSPMRP